MGTEMRPYIEGDGWGMNAEELQGALDEAVGPQCPAAWQGWVTILASAGKQGKPVGVDAENYG